MQYRRFRRGRPVSSASLKVDRSQVRKRSLEARVAVEPEIATARLKSGADRQAAAEQEASLRSESSEPRVAWIEARLLPLSFVLRPASLDAHTHGLGLHCLRSHGRPKLRNELCRLDGRRLLAGESSTDSSERSAALPRGCLPSSSSLQLQPFRRTEGKLRSEAYRLVGRRCKTQAARRM